jgi:acetyl-CoA C-acetyltransferase
MANVVIVDGVRTAVGSFGGTLKDVPAKELGALVMREVLLRNGLVPDVSSAVKEDAP